MQTVFFIGGPLDGELREVPDGCCFGAREGALYFYGNGIARHESVSEEEVARRVQRLLAERRTNNSYDGLPCTCTIACKTACKGECGCDACRNAYCDSQEYA